MKWLFLFILSVSVVGCGQKSKVDKLFEAVELKNSHGDGEYTVFTVKMPLSDQSIDTFDSPIDPNSGLSRVPVVGDITRLLTQTLFNLGAELGFGQQRITINQPIPDLETPYLKSIAIKRVFFHIDSTVQERPRARNILARVFDGFRGLLRGGTELDFSFIRKLDILLRMEKTTIQPASFIPEIITEDTNGNEDIPVNEDIQIGTRAGVRTIELLKYEREKREAILRNNERGAMFVVYTAKPVKVKSFIKRDAQMASLVKEMVVVNKTLVVELNGKEQVAEAFFEHMRNYEAEMEDSEISKIDTCNEDICMDVKVNEQNMLPLLLQGNKLRIETNLDASRVPPKSFQLKGFIEFEIKLDVPL